MCLRKHLLVPNDYKFLPKPLNAVKLTVIMEKERNLFMTNIDLENLFSLNFNYRRYYRKCGNLNIRFKQTQERRRKCFKSDSQRRLRKQYRHKKITDINKHGSAVILQIISFNFSIRK